MDTLKWLHRHEQRFVCPVSCDRPVSVEPGQYQRVDRLGWTEEQFQHGQGVGLRGFGAVRVFRRVVRRGDTETVDDIITNAVEGDESAVIREVLPARWRIEQYHRELKQLTGIEGCQARKGRSQRNHIWCAMRVWLALWQRAREVGQTVYAVKRGLWDEYLRQQLFCPALPIGAI